MKLYGTITSERASKGQGGQHLDIVITDEHRNEVALLHASFTNDKPRVSLIASNYDTACTLENDAQVILRKYKALEKGEKQKGERTFEQQLADHKHDAITKFR